MSYIALARKWRPRTFSELVGQEHITKALTKSLTQQRLHHAYLFTGTRGVGKTSVARLLAKALSCEQGMSAKPCLTCDACMAIERGCFVDLIEVDGASRTRVEDTRELLENIHYAPTHGRFKIYLIDEVHMLSQHSFNALLKTLEEPPAHVKFLLATTDPHKLPVTILSRCLQFGLKHLEPDVIKQQLIRILHDEALDYEGEALDLLARAADGSMRDALSLLDQAIATTEDCLNTNDVKKILGMSQKDYALALLTALCEQAPHTLMSISQEIAKEGGYFEYTLDELLSYLHQISIHQHLGSNHPLIAIKPELAALSEYLNKEDTQLFYQIGIKGREEMQLAPTMAIGFEMTLLRMYAFMPARPSKAPLLAHETKKNISHLEYSSTLGTGCEKEVHQAEHSEGSANLQEPPHCESPAHEIPCNKTQDEHIGSTPTSHVVLPEITQSSSLEDPWLEVLANLQLTGLARNAIEHAQFVEKQTNQIVLLVATGHLSLFTPATIARIESELSRYYKEPMKMVLKNEQKTNDTPAQKKETSRVLHQQAATDALQTDVFFQQLQQEFSADVVKNSISPKR